MYRKRRMKLTWFFYVYWICWCFFQNTHKNKFRLFFFAMFVCMCLHSTLLLMLHGCRTFWLAFACNKKTFVFFSYFSWKAIEITFFTIQSLFFFYKNSTFFHSFKTMYREREETKHYDIYTHTATLHGISQNFSLTLCIKWFTKTYTDNVNVANIALCSIDD